MTVLAAMQGLGWWAYKVSQGSGTGTSTEKAETIATEKIVEKGLSDNSGIVDLDLSENQERDGGFLVDGGITYPLVQIEEVDGITERTIHMGVRQWAWDPFDLEAKQGEKVRLVIHNADILHSIEIRELGVSAAIPEEGAIVEFMADRAGTFEFSCGETSCGKDHDKMRGKLTIL
ncbi:MAG: hypothetical protein UX75_C0004G0031 [Candidatus Moranbacteria bacterium GW2011_GWE2_47_10]|nr:MAG: hypothetical protein UX75_C0004G0031 [Candidatus Moranbacteria bacterium GW2011_GWE2_47_10]